MTIESVSNLAKRQKSDWRKWAKYWSLFTKPSRPSRDDIKIFGKLIDEYIGSRPNPTIVILGSTPEFRELCFTYSLRYKAKIICVELIRDIYMGMKKLLDTSNTMEKVLICNWLSVELPNESADVVIGDLTDGNISFNLKTQYYKEIVRVLKPNGLYITRMAAYPSRTEITAILTIDQIKSQLIKYCNAMLNGDITILEASNYLGADMAFYSYYKTNGKRLSYSVYKNEIHTLIEITKDDLLAQQILQLMEKIWGPIKDKHWDYYSLDKTILNLNIFFKDIKYYFSNDYPVASLTPIFVMKKK